MRARAIVRLGGAVGLVAGGKSTPTPALRATSPRSTGERNACGGVCRIPRVGRWKRRWRRRRPPPRSAARIDPPHKGEGGTCYLRFIASSRAAPKAPCDACCFCCGFGEALNDFASRPLAGAAERGAGSPPSLRMVRPMRLRVTSTSTTRTLHHVAGLHHLVRVLDEAVGELARRARGRPGARRCRRRRRRRRRW